MQKKIVQIVFVMEIIAICALHTIKMQNAIKPTQKFTNHKVQLSPKHIFL